MGRPRVLGLVDAVPEAHDLLALREPIADLLRHGFHGIAAGLPDRLQAEHDLLIRTAVQRPRQGAETRAAKVDAFIVWSAWSTRHVSKISAARSSGRAPVSCSRKFAAMPRLGSAATSSRPFRAAW